ncbi:putative TIM-barrel fold metal-dependent hydrolase [Paraburkholderia sp. WC7.3d]
MLQDLPDPAWIRKPFADRALTAMAQARLTFDALIRPAHLPAMLDLIESHPELTVVIDHAAKPVISSTRDRDAWINGLAALATHASVYCKLSGLWNEAAPGRRLSELEPWATHVLDMFGVQRTIWSSDWPVVRCAGSGRAWFEFALDLIASHGEDAVRQVLGANARRAYRLAPASNAIETDVSPYRRKRQETLHASATNQR